MNTPKPEKLLKIDAPNHSCECLLTYLADTFVIFFGSWTLIHQFSYFGGLSFYQSWNIAFWVSATSVLVYIAKNQRAKKGFPFQGTPFYVWLGIVFSVCLALVLYRPDSDDEHYLGQAILALDFTFERMKSLPGISTGYALTSYDFIRAALSYYTGMPILYAFYVVGPVLISILVVIFQWRLLKILAVKHITFALFVFFIVMLAWGDVHRSPANLGYVKFFQGKGALVWVAIPAMLFYWLQFELTRSKQSLILLLMSAICGVGFSATGIPIAILMAILFFMSGLMQIQNKKNLLIRTFFLIIILVVFSGLGLLIKKYFGYSSSGIHSSVGVRELNNFSDYLVNWEMLHFVLGDTMRFWIALLSLAACPFLLTPSSARNLFRAYLGLCIIIMIIPFSSAVMAQFSTGSFAWRWLFVCPFVLCIIVVVDYILSLKNNIYLKVTTVTIYLGGFIACGPLLVSQSNHTQFRFLFHQLPDEQKIILRPSPYNYRTTKLDGGRIISLKDGRPL